MVARGWTDDEKPNLCDSVRAHHQRSELLVDEKLASSDDDGIVYRADMRLVVLDVYRLSYERVSVSD